MAAYIEMTHTAYPLTSKRYASEMTIEVYDEPGYSADLLCTMNVSHPDAEDMARAFAAKWSSIPEDEVRVSKRYFVREHRSAIISEHTDEHGAVRQLSPTRRIEADEYHSLLRIR